MGGARETPDNAAVRRDDAPAEGRRRPRGATGPPGLLALQRSAGNAAVSALLAGRMRSAGAAAVTDIDAALREVRQDEPAVETVEKGLRAAKAAGVPVDLDGAAQKPPASALAVVRTGFGPEAVPARKPVPPPKPVPKVSPLGRSAAKTAKGAGRGATPAGAPAPASAASAPAPAPAGPAGPVAARPAADRLLAPPVPPPGVRPPADPSFTHVAGAVKGAAKAKRAHPPAAAKAKEAQAAAVAPADDLAGQAKAAKVDTMDAQQPGTFDKKAFIGAVKAAIEAKSPKTLKEADDYKKSGKAGEVKGEVKGLVTSGTQGQARDIDTATDAPPDQSKAVAKPVTPMAPEEAGPPPSVAAAGAAPKPAPAEQTNLAAGPHEADQEMAQGEVTEQQLAESNEPQFQQALTDKQAAAAHAQTAPAEFRQHEQAVITEHKADATAQATAGVAGMQSSKGAALAALVAAKGKTKTKDEAKRAEVTAKIQGIFAATEKDVKAILDGLDPKVDKAFTDGEAKARQAFEAFVDTKMRAYKKDRYGGWLGGLRWAKDKLLGMPDKVNEFYSAGRELYLKQMDGVISGVADVVATDLTAAKKRIATGRAEIAGYVKSLPADLQKVGSEASKEIGDRFAQLESDVDAKQEALVDTLATKYVEARKGLDERIEALQAENKGLVDKAIGAIKAVINTIRELVSMLTGVLARAASVIGDIVKAPVRFLGNLIDGVKGGILKFKDNILDHLRKGLMSWLFGALAEAGVELPEKFDLMGIIKLLASLFGLTWTNIRNRIVKQVGEKAMAAIEKGVEIFSVLRTQGVAGLWQMLLDKLGDIKEMILAQVKDFVITKIITAGITWLIGLLNPAAAFIKACKMIYDIVMFFVDNGSRILKFVNTVIDSVADIVKGNVSGVVNKINDVLGQMVPIIIGFLASLVGLGGIGAKIRSIIETLQKPVNKALDFVIKTGLKLAGPIIRGIKGISGKVKAKVAAGKAWVKGKVEAGKKWVKGKVEAGKQWARGTTGGGAAEDRRGGAPARADLDVTMHGRRHQLSAGGEVGRKVYIASVSGPVSVKVGALLAALTKSGAPPAPPDQIARLKDIQAKALAFENALATLAKGAQIPIGDKVVVDLVSAITSYGTTYEADDFDPLGAKKQALRKHPGYLWLAANGFSEPMEARIIAHIDEFDEPRLHRVLDKIHEFSARADFVDKKLKPALTEGRYFTPNRGAFYEIEDLDKVTDVDAFNVKIPKRGGGGTKEIDVLSTTGMLMDQKFAVELDDPDYAAKGAAPKLKARMVGQAEAMEDAMAAKSVTLEDGTKRSVTGWEFHHRTPLDPAVATLIAARGWAKNFVHRP